MKPGKPLNQIKGGTRKRPALMVLVALVGMAIPLGVVAVDANAAETAPSGQLRSGTATYYNDAGYGACGDRIDAAGDMLVAMSYKWFTSANPNNDPLCGVKIEVTFKGKSITVPIADECPSCDAAHIDLSQAAFAHFATTDAAVTPGVLNVHWRFLSTQHVVTAVRDVSGPASGEGGQITGLGGKCIGAAWAVIAEGTAVDLYPCVGSKTQQWSWDTDGTVRNNGLCLDVADSGTADGSGVELSDCDNTPAQQWTYTKGHDIVNKNAGKCLDVTGHNDTDYTTTQLWSCSGGTNQKWNIQG